MALNTDKSAFGLDVTGRLKRPKAPAHTDTHTDADATTPAYTDVYADAYEDTPAPKKENKTKRMFLLARPSVYEKLENYAKAHDDSVNNLVHTLMEEFIEKKGL